MPRDCIIGGGPTGSREHIFPASLGGRRTNKGIYCGKHNNGFSDLAGSLSSQLKIINSLLGVRSDHSDTPHVFEHTTPDGEKWRLNSDGASKDSNNAHSNKPLHLQFTLGGPEGLKAITYVALTFFAHHFPEAARKPQLAPVKEYIQDNAENDFAWWEEAEAVNKLPKNKFHFGHTIGLVTSAKNGDAYALVSLFSTLNFGVHLGKLDNAVDKTVIVFIDPHAEHAPNDIHEIKSDKVEFDFTKPTPLYAHLKRMVHEKSGENSLQNLFAKIEEWKFANEMASTLVSLNESRFISEEDQWHQIIDIVQEQTTRVHRLLVHFAKMFKEKSDGSKQHAVTAEFLDGLIARHPADPAKLTDAATHATSTAMEAIAHDLKRKLSQDDIDMEYLWFLFSGTTGLKIAATAVFDDIKDISEIRVIRDFLNQK